MERVNFNTYEYDAGDCIGSYTLKEGIKPLHFKKEKLVNSFSAIIYSKEERKNFFSKQI